MGSLFLVLKTFLRPELLHFCTSEFSFLTKLLMSGWVLSFSKSFMPACTTILSVEEFAK